MTTLTFEQYLEIMYDETSIKKQGKLVYKHLQGQHDQQTHDPTTGSARHAFNPPALPAELRSGTVGQAQARLAARAKIMEATYGVKFSLSGSNPLGVAEGKKLGQPGIGLPRAIYDSSVDAVTDSEIIKTVTEAGKKWGGSSGYVTYTTLKFATGLSFQQIFGVIKNLKSADPYAVSFSVDRQGNNAQVKFVAKQAKLVYKGGEGSGNFDHQGRPGLVGGSSSEDRPRVLPGSKAAKVKVGVSLYHYSPYDSSDILKNGLLRSSKVKDLSSDTLVNYMVDHPVDGVFLGSLEQVEVIRDQFREAADDPSLGNIYEVYIPNGSIVYQDPLMPESSVMLEGDIPRRRINIYRPIRETYELMKHMSQKFLDDINWKDIDEFGKIIKEYDILKGSSATARQGKLVYKGGEGSGFEDHKGRPGEVGGSVARDTVLTSAQWTE